MSDTLVPLEDLTSRQDRQDQDEGTFQYQQLETQDWFRPLRLHSGQGDKIKCSLHHFTLASESCPTYRAISCTWGKDAARSVIYIDDSTIAVRENLRDALHCLRDKDTGCWLWIDAICIDQNSFKERNHQVKLMAGIYGNANFVLVCLQSAGKKTDVKRAFEVIRAFAAPIAGYQDASAGDPKDWCLVLQLCKMRYWIRKWIIQ